MKSLKFISFYKWEKVVAPLFVTALLLMTGGLSVDYLIFAFIPLIYHIFCGIMAFTYNENFVKLRFYSDLATIGYGIYYTLQFSVLSVITILALQKIDAPNILTYILVILPIVLTLIGITSIIYGIFCVRYFKKYKDEVNAVFLVERNKRNLTKNV